MLVYLPCIGADVCPLCGTVYSGGQAAEAAQEPAPLLVLLRHVETRLTCFISYGHDGLTHVSRHLHKLLTARGHSVWFDEVSLAHGCDWAKEMEAGIRNAMTAGDSGRFVVMLAKHGFRRDMETADAQGFCHREASLAYESMPHRCLALQLQDMDLPTCLAMANAHILDVRHISERLMPAPPYCVEACSGNMYSGQAHSCNSAHGGLQRRCVGTAASTRTMLLCLQQTAISAQRFTPTLSGRHGLSWWAHFVRGRRRGATSKCFSVVKQDLARLRGHIGCCMPEQGLWASCAV